MTIQLFLGLAFLVVVHELGHLLFARLFGMRVEKFALFIDAFNFKLFKIRKGVTEYVIGWIPIGGYVKIAGMVDESVDIDQLREDPKSWEFRSFSIWKRVLVLLGGVIMNILVGIIIFWGITFFGEKEFLPIANITDGIYATKEGKAIGFQNGDIITKVNGHKIYRFQDATPPNFFVENTFTVLRGEKTVEIKAPPIYENEIANLFLIANCNSEVGSVLDSSPANIAGIIPGDRIESIDGYKVSVFGDIGNILTNITKKDTVKINIIRDRERVTLKAIIGKDRILGINSSTKYHTEKYGLYTSFIYGYKKSINLIKANLSGFVAIFKGKLKATESLTGPIGIAKIYGNEFHAIKFWTITGLISLILALTNLLPIPALDGGQILINVVEGIIGRELPEKLKISVQIAGMIFLLGLMLFVVVNDIVRF